MTREAVVASERRVGSVRRVAGLVFLACGMGLGNVMAQSGTDTLPALRPISPVEKAAVSLALDYFAKGAAGWTKAFSLESRFANLSAGELEAEIEARVGPAGGAKWELLTIDPELKEQGALFSIE